MSIPDHGIEGLRKALSLVTAGNTTETKLRTFSVTGMLSDTFDYVAVTYPLATQEVYVFKSGGVGGTTVATITINYTDSTKASLLNVAKS